MSPLPKMLSTTVACRVARLDRDRLNEAIAAGRFPCAPATIPGRARYFDPDNMIALCTFSELTDDGVTASVAGHIACEVSAAARQHPDARAISYVRATAVKSGFTVDRMALPADQLPDPSTWNTKLFNDTDLIERVLTFNVWQMRQRIKERTEEEARYIGSED